MKKLKIFESINPEILKSFINTDDYQQLTPLKQNMIYSYVMIETGQMTFDEIRDKFGVADGALKGWLKYGEDFFDTMIPSKPIYNMNGRIIN